MTGAVAARALPPQMAVPEAIKRLIFLSSFNILANKNPRTITITMVDIVNKKPCEPAETAVSRSIPKPKLIIEY